MKYTYKEIDTNLKLLNELASDGWRLVMERERDKKTVWLIEKCIN